MTETTDQAGQSAPAVFNVHDFEDVPQADVAIKDPTTGSATTMIVTLAGPEHPTRRKILLAKQRRMRAQLQKTGKLQFGTPEEDEEDETETLVRCTLGWRGANVPFSADAARALYTDTRLRWLRDQVKSALDEREHFIRSSAPA